MVERKQKKMIESVKKANSKKVIVEGIEYSSVIEAAEKLGVNKNTAYGRIKSKSFPQWYYVDDKSRTTISKESRLQA